MGNFIHPVTHQSVNINDFVVDTHLKTEIDLHLKLFKKHYDNIQKMPRAMADNFTSTELPKLTIQWMRSHTPGLLMAENGLFNSAARKLLQKKWEDLPAIEMKPDVRISKR